MVIQKVTDASFKAYGRVITEVDFTELVDAMQSTPVPADVVYVPGDEKLESLAVAEKIRTVCYGETDIQIGYCNGHNQKLNAVEYHRSSEINVGGTDAILIVGKVQDITPEHTYETAKMEAFLLPKGTAVEVYATTLHYAPCGVNGAGFQVTIVLPKGTNYPLAKDHKGGEDDLITATNKWLIAHEEAKIEGAVCGLIGENLTV